MGLGKPGGKCFITSTQPIGVAAHTPSAAVVTEGTHSALTNNISLAKLPGSLAFGVSGVRRSLAKTSNNAMSMSKPPAGSVSPTDSLKRLSLTQPSDDSRLSKFTGHTTNAARPKDLTLTQPVEDTMLSKFTPMTNAARPKHLTLTQPSADTTLAKFAYRTNASRGRRKKRGSLERGIMLRDRDINLVDPGSPTDDITVLSSQHVLIRARGNDNRFMTQRHGDVKMRVISDAAQLCHAVFRIQDFLDEDTGCVLSTIFHVASQSFLGVAPDTHDVILMKKDQPLGSQPSSGIVTLHSPSTDLDQPPLSGNTTVLGTNNSSTLTRLSSSSGLSLDFPKIDTRPSLSSNVSFDMPDFGENSLTPFSDDDDFEHWPPHPCCLFIIISESHACFKPAICQDESLSFRHSDGELVTVKDYTPWVFSFESPRKACHFFSNPQARNMLKKAAFVVLFVQSLAD